MGEGAAYFGALDALTAEDPEIHRTVLEVFQLARPLLALWQEPLFSRVTEKIRERSAKSA